MRIRLCRLAESLAKNTSWDTGFRVLALVCKGGKILKIGQNRLQPIPHRNIHAERSAIKGIKNIGGSEIYICRLGKGKKPTMSMPCRDCLRLILDSDISSVYYTDYSGKWCSLF